MKILQWTQRFFAMGIGTIPLYHRSKIPDVSLTGGTWEQFMTQANTEYQLKSWFATDWLNYGVVAGWNNLVIIDFDNIEWFNIWNLWFSTNNTEYDPEMSFKVRTCHGMHVYVTTETPACNGKRISIKGGIDIQAQGKFVVGPGCVHPSGHVYEPIGEMVFPMVTDIETILPLDLFPPVQCNDIVFTGEPVEFVPIHTEYLSDPFAVASMDTTDLITKIKRSVRIESLFPDAYPTSRDGRWLATICPFHDDHHPSFWIDTVKQLCGCQVCNMKDMDAVNLYSRMHNISNSAAVTVLAEELRIWR